MDAAVGTVLRIVGNIAVETVGKMVESAGEIEAETMSAGEIEAETMIVVVEG